MAEFTYEIENERKVVQVTPTDGGYLVTINERSYRVAAQAAGTGHLELVIDERRQRAFVTSGENNARDVRRIWLDGQLWSLTKRDGQARHRSSASDAESGALSASMPGQVREILVIEGDQVSAGTPLIILEAMKMEMRITALAVGTVKKIHCSLGDVVERGQLLVELVGAQ